MRAPQITTGMKVQREDVTECKLRLPPPTDNALVRVLSVLRASAFPEQRRKRRKIDAGILPGFFHFTKSSGAGS